jgi:hypothetical protein
VTSTYVVDANNDGNADTPYVAITLGDGSSGVLVDDFEQTITQEITQDIVLGAEGLVFVENDGDVVSGQVEFIQQIEQEIPMFYDNAADYDLGAEFFGLADPTNPNVDVNGGTDAGSNITIVQVLADGWVEIQQDFVQTIDQDIVQDVYYEIDIVQDFIQVQDINQTYTADLIQTETRTRLVGE